MKSPIRTPAIEVRNATKRYGKSRGIESVSLTVFKGEIFGFLGPNGAGKSTTINIILDLLRADEGTIKLLGIDARKDPVAAHRKIGYLSGDMATDPSLTGGQYLEFAANLRGGVSEEKIDELVKRLRCETNKKIKHLSRGNRQKIGLVAALMHDPDILILDEPTSGLDPLIQSEFNAIIKEHQARGKTTFMSSHTLSEVQAVCDRVGFIRDGKLVNVGDLEALISQAPRRVSATYQNEAPVSRLRHLSGVSDLAADGHSCQFSFRGNYNDLLQAIGTKPLLSLQITEPSLEELFMTYYQVAPEGGTDV